MEAQTRTSRGRWARWVIVFATLGVAGVAWHVKARRAADCRESQAAAEGPLAAPAIVPEWASTPAPFSRETEVSRSRLAAPRWAAALTLTTLFFAGASFTAFAGDQAASLFDGEAAVAVAAAEALPEQAVPATTEESGVAMEEAEVALEPEVALEAEVAQEPAATEAVAVVPEQEAAEQDVVQPEAASASAPETAAVEEPEPAHGAQTSAAAGEQAVPAAAAARRVAVASPKVATPKAAPEDTRSRRPAEAAAGLDPEASAPGVQATIWLHRELGDPTPPSLRLSATAASRLVSFAKREGAQWELVLGVLRAGGSRAMPSRARTIADAARLVAGGSVDHGGWALALKSSGRTAAADRALALARYYRAVGMKALVGGLLSQQEALAKQVLADRRITLYDGGRNDVAAGGVDVRVLALVAYLAEAYGQVTVSSLVAGHRLYSRPGVVSAHVYGQAVDIAALAGMPIAGNQQVGGLTERAVRDILLLPAEVRPRQLISLLGMGGPSFPLPDHGDHIHVGF